MKRSNRFRQHAMIAATSLFADTSKHGGIVLPDTASLGSIYEKPSSVAYPPLRRGLAGADDRVRMASAMGAKSVAVGA